MFGRAGFYSSYSAGHLRNFLQVSLRSRNERGSLDRTHHFACRWFCVWRLGSLDRTLRADGRASALGLRVKGLGSRAHADGRDWHCCACHEVAGHCRILLTGLVCVVQAKLKALPHKHQLEVCVCKLTGRVHLCRSGLACAFSTQVIPSQQMERAGCVKQAGTRHGRAL
jgi:hypothetical protein